MAMEQSTMMKKEELSADLGDLPFDVSLSEGCNFNTVFDIIGGLTSSQDVQLNISHQLHDDAETMDVSALEKFCDVPAQEQEVFVPVTPLGPPDRTIFTGPLNFTCEVNSEDIHKKKFLYSHKLNRIYVNMKCNFSVLFKWDHHNATYPLFVRATTVYSDVTQAEKRVERCLQHLHDSSNKGVDKAIVSNVLHTAREAGTRGVVYCGHADQRDSWLSVLVQFSQPASHAYQFVCKNSCATGINRRAIDIIFTLENQIGAVFGRQRVGARVCACPKRDIVRDETAEGEFKPGKKRVASNTVDSDKAKKLKKTPVQGDDVITLPPVQIIGRNVVKTGLTVMKEMMKQAYSLIKNEQEKENYKKCIDNLKSTIEELDQAKQPPAAQ